MVRFEIVYSPITFTVLAVLHLLATVSVWVSNLPMVGQVLFSSLVVVSAGSVWRDYGCNSPLRWQHCSINKHGSLLRTRRKRVACGLPSPIFVSEYLVVLEFPGRDSNRLVRRCGRYKLILAADALQERDFCRLQRYLRFEI